VRGRIAAYAPPFKPQVQRSRLSVIQSREQLPDRQLAVRFPGTMDITKTVVSLREKALLYGDYGTYHTQLSKKLLNCRKKVNIATKNRGKFQNKGTATAEHIAENHEYGASDLQHVSSC